MDRSIVYTSALPRTVDFLNTNLFAMLGLGYAMEGCLGYTGSIPAPPYVHGMQCTPTIPSADLNVHVNTGAIYAVDNIDSSAYSDLGTNTGSVLKQGLLQVPVTLAITPPGTPGYSQIYLVEVILGHLAIYHAIVHVRRNAQGRRGCTNGHADHTVARHWLCRTLCRHRHFRTNANHWREYRHAFQCAVFPNAAVNSGSHSERRLDISR